MTPKATSHVIQGMQKDTSKSKLSKEFAFHNHNIRITAREDSTLLSITNEKGTTSNGFFKGIYIGHCVIQDALVIFNKCTAPEDPDKPDRILLYYPKKHSIYKQLYSGNLNFSENNPIEALGVYENERIQKVYWVDGINQPRIINIAAEDKIKEKWTDSSFDFIPELALQESVSVEAVSNSSMFAPGVIQYAFSYYNKYGQESNIFDVTPLCYIAHKERGASPEEVIKDIAFKIRVDNVDTNFDYVRIYSIHRTSLDAVPTCKKLIDLPINIPPKKIEVTNSYQDYNLEETDTQYIYCTSDTGQTHTLSEIINLVNPTTVGNVTIWELDFTDYVDIVLKRNNEIKNRFDFSGVRKCAYREINNGLLITKDLICYSYKTSILVTEKIDNPNYIPSIEYIDNGTLGDTIDPTQLLYIGGEDIIAGTITSKDNTLFLGNIELKQLSVADDLKALIKDRPITPKRKYLNNNEEALNSYHYSNVFINDYSYFKPGEHYRLGVQLQYKNGKWSEPIFVRDYTVPLGSNPVVDNFNISFPSMSFYLKEEVKNNILERGFKRIRGLVVFPENHERKVIAQGMLCPTVYNPTNRDNNNPYSQSSWFIRPNMPYEITDFSSNEDSNNIEKGSIVEFRHNKPLLTGANRGSEIQNNVEYKVDQSILTFHSPDVEFGQDTLINSKENVRMRIVGLINFTSNYGDIDIQTSSTTLSSNAKGFLKNKLNDLEGGERSLVSGLFYEDKNIINGINTYIANFLVYPWHRSGSLNADNASLSSSENRTQSAVLKSKKISNFKISKFNKWLDKKLIWELKKNNHSTEGILNIDIFDSNQNNLIKLKKDKNYYGNYDSLLVNTDPYDFYYAYVFNGELTSSTNSDRIQGNDPVRIKYKSSNHLILNLGRTLEGNINILPSICIFKNNEFIPINNINNTPELNITDDSSLYFAQYRGEEYPSKVEATFTDGDIYIRTIPDSSTVEISKYNLGDTITEWRRISPTTSYNIGFIQDNIVDIYSYGDAFPEKDYMFQAAWVYSGSVPLDTISGIKTIKQEYIEVDSIYPYLYIADIYRDDNFIQNAFGGITEEAIKNNLWLPASRSVSIDTGEITYEYGDTRYQRYDCLKTYAFTPEDENQVIEIASFMCETRVNMLGRYDKNIGNLSNLNADPTNFNLFNPVYSQKDNFFNYRILDSDIYKLDKFNNTITWSKEKYAGEDVDTWTNITMANTLDLDGTKGKVNKLLTFKDQIFAFQDRGISNILFNSRVQIPVSDGVPIEISNGMKVEGLRYISDNIGCQNKNSIVTTPSGVYFLDSESGGIYLLADGLTNLSTNKGFDIWTKEVSNNPAFKSFYDKNNKDVYFNTADYSLCYSEKLGNFTSFYDYNGTEAMFNVGDSFYSIITKNKEIPGDTKTHLYKMFNGSYNNFFDNIKPYSITIISNEDPQVDKVFTNLDYRADFFDSNNNYLENESFDTIKVWNEYQEGEETLKYSKFRPSNLKKKFRIWGANIPRDKKNKLDRMRNPWLYIKLSKENPGTSKMELHDLVVKYLE